MKNFLMLPVVFSGLAVAAPVVRMLDWEPACEGAIIEVTSDGGKILKIVADAEHSTSARGWVVVFAADGRPGTATYEEFRIEHVLEGEHAGERKGMTSIRKESWKAVDGKFPIKDDKLAKDLADVLSKAKPK